MEEKRYARPAVSGLLFLGVAAGWGYLLRQKLLLPIPQHALPMLAELATIPVSALCAIWTANRRGWRGKVFCGIAIGLYAAYALFCALNFQWLATLYAAQMGEAHSTGMALVVVKLVLLLLALIAAIPAKETISSAEFADRFVDIMELQKRTWARDAVKGAKEEAARMEAECAEAECAEAVVCDQEAARARKEAERARKEQARLERVNDIGEALRDEDGNIDFPHNCC